ncbi:MAG: methylenetetrahydrofolate reductase [Thermoleophilia bacterium]
MSPAFSDKLARGFFVCTADVLPSLSGRPLQLSGEVIEGLRNAGCAVNVADMPSAVLAQAPIAAAVGLLEAGIEPVLQVTGRDRNRLALQADLLAAHALGVRNLLCLTGDHISFGDHPEARAVFDLSATEILMTVRALNSGRTLGGRPLDAPTEFTAGAALNPGQVPLEPQLARALAKQRAGAAFFQTQPFFRVADAVDFLDAAAAAGLSTPILAGVFLLESVGMARFMNDRVPGVVVPPDVVRGLEAAHDPVAYGSDVAREIVRWARGAHSSSGPAPAPAPATGPAPPLGLSSSTGPALPSCPALPPRPAGVHVMSLNRHAAVIDVLLGNGSADRPS